MTRPVPARVVGGLRDRGPIEATVDTITVGDAAVLVELTGPEGRLAGLAHRPDGPAPERSDPDVETLLSWAAGTENGGGGETPVATALGLAAANALSAPHVVWRTGDPMVLLDAEVDRIATVGLFRPAFRKFDDVAVSVIERDPVGEVSAPAGVRVETVTPDATATAMAGAEVVFITGSAFVYGGAERYLDAVPEAATAVVVGATASFLPEPLFDAGADVVAGASVTEPRQVRAAVEAGACGTTLHDAGVRKVYVATDRARGVRVGGAGRSKRGGENHDRE
ncbi:Rossmann-like domain-containing protein [Haloplanus sp.]|uniref:Rossmann-like domain-containing protein n=1 Tax=Haloplanus sp. TaxID=1961696 RepID=UPI002627C078|nr:DUF364 domain-containing protein [Haloplanus sp.]